VNLEDKDPPEFHLAVLNVQIRELMDKALRKHGLKLVEWRILQSLGNSGTLTICDLAELSVVERTVTSRLVDKLVERGFLIKKPMPNDRRFAEVALSEAGSEQLATCATDVMHARNRLFEDVDEHEFDQLLKTLVKLQKNSAGTRRN
jgi:MarR family transcriptional regulator for hemolysin